MNSNLEVEIGIRVTKEIADKIDEQIRKDKDAFPNRSQFVRSAVFRRLRELQEETKLIKESGKYFYRKLGDTP